MAARKAKAKAPKAASGKSKKKLDIDWEGVESVYCAGIISLRAISAKYGISVAYIRKRAEAEGWQRSLADKVRRAAAAQLVHKDGVQERARAPEKEIVAAAAQVIVNVVREHQGMIRRGRDVIEQLLAEIAENNRRHDELVETIEAEPGESITAIERKKRMLKAVSLPQRVGIITNLSAAMKNVTALERQAFSVDNSSPASSDEGADISALNDELDRRYGRRAAA
jgi:hypothetical protein